MRKIAMITILSTLFFQANALDSNQTVNSENNQMVSSSSDAPAAIANWDRYDFVPGDVVFFEDNQEGEINGNFPSKWQMGRSGLFENGKLGEDNVIIFSSGNTGIGTGIVPIVENSDQDYLEEQFTIEFDAYFEEERQSGQAYYLRFSDGVNQKVTNPDHLLIRKNSISTKNGSAQHYPNTSKNNKTEPIWRHISISYDKGALKAYLDDTRLINIPDRKQIPTGVTIAYAGSKHNGYIKNVRIAQGTKDINDKMLQDGKIVTTAIRFDVNKATIKPESSGAINEIVAFMKQDTSLRFSIEGHTDSDGSKEANQILSENRADAVKNRFIELGIDASRLETKGFGEDKPVASNDTSEGKANNRRVEFVKL